MTDEVRPVPDPTVLTTAALYHEIGVLRRLMEERIAGLSALVDERFAAVVREQASTERQRQEQKADTKAAVDAALAAAKEAVKEQTIASERAISKSETATTKAIEQQAATLTETQTGQRRDIDDLKGRMTTVEAVKIGAVEAKSSISSVATLGIAALGFLLAVLTTAVAVYIATH